MECSVCHVRSTVGYCKTCERMLCEVCSIPCDRCKKIVCRAHRETTPGGRNLCPECMAERNAKRARLEQEEAAKKKQPAVVSFQDLLSEFDDELVPGMKPAAAPEAPQEEALDWRPDWAGEAPAPVQREEKPRTLEDDLNARVLTASAPPPRPMWIGSLIVGALACALVLTAARTPMFRTVLQPWISYLIILVGVGAIAWAVAGFFNRETPVRDRRLCGIGFGLAMFAIIGAWVIRQG